MELGDIAWGRKMFQEFIGSLSDRGLVASPQEPECYDVIKYIKDNSVLNEGRENLDKLPLDFQGFYYSEREANSTKYFGFVNLDAHHESFYFSLPKEMEWSSLSAIQLMCADAKLHDWGKSYDWERRDIPHIGWSIPNFWDITDLVMGGIKRGLFINWPLDPPRIGDDV